MRTRSLQASDIPQLRALYEQSGFAYEWPDLESADFEAVEVLVDESDRPLMAAAAKRTIELYLFAGNEGFEHPAAKLHAIRLLHGVMAPLLRTKGYTEANAFLPPQVEMSFGRRLMKTFGWMRNWTSYCIRF